MRGSYVESIDSSSGEATLFITASQLKLTVRDSDKPGERSSAGDSQAFRMGLVRCILPCRQQIEV